MKSLGLEIRSYITIFSLIFLIAFLSSCQTIQPVEPKVEVKSELSFQEKPRVFQTDKPLACVESNLALSKLKEMAGETPYAIWYDSIKKYQILMMVNKEAKTVTVMEYIPTPSEFVGTDDIQYVCFLSMGANLYLNNKVETTAIINLKTWK